MSDHKRTRLEEKWETVEGSAAGGAPDGTAATGAADDGQAAPGDEIAALREEAARLRDQLLRQHAEMVNFRRRTERDREESREIARAGVVRELLSAIDDFERAALFQTDNFAAYRDGVQLIMRSLADALQRIGVQRVDPLGEPFDPNVHEALDSIASDEVAPDHVARVYKPGYRLGERLLRPATVAVAVAAAPVADGES